MTASADSIPAAVEQRLLEFESHISRIGGLEHREIVLSAAIARSSSEYADLRASLYAYADEQRQVAGELRGELEKLLKARAEDRELLLAIARKLVTP